MLPPPRMPIVRSCADCSWLAAIVAASRRGPNSAVPMRTRVAPSAMAASRVAAHAHRQRVERRRRARSAARSSARSCANQWRWRAGSVLLRAACTSGRAASAAAARATARGERRHVPPGATPPLLASPADVDLQAHIQRRRRGTGRCADRRSAMRRRSTPCTQAKCSATARVLLACSAADEVPGERAGPRARRSWAAPPAGSSRRSRCSPAAAAARTSAERLRLADRQECDGVAHSGPRRAAARSPRARVRALPARPRSARILRTD